MFTRHMLVRACVVALAIVPFGFSGTARAQSETDYYDNAVGLMGQKNYPAAEAEFHKSIHADPRYKEAWEGLAAVLKAEGKDATAVQQMADAAPAARAGAAPALSAEQLAALGEAGGAPVAVEAATPQSVKPEIGVAPVAAPAPAPGANAAPAQVLAPINVPDVPLDQSDIVVKNPDGSAGVLQKDGKPFDGVKLSNYDAEIFSPQIAIGADNTIHVAFVERQQISPYAFFVFYRQSTDGEKTWSDPKNLSENLAGFQVGNCKLLVDGQNRVYVIWRSSLKEAFPVLQTPAGNGQHNLVYRVLEGGKWSKILYVHPPGSPETQDNGSVSYMATVDAAGHAQVLYNMLPDRFHPDQVMVVSPTYSQHINGIGRGLMFQATLDGKNPTTPRELFMANFKVDPTQGVYGKSCDDLDALDGYVDSNGQSHFLARVISAANASDSNNTHIDLFEDGKQTPAIVLPGSYTQLWSNIPTLLVDAAGKRHVIALYNAGEHPAFRDYLVGSDEDPTVILTAKGQKGTCKGFRAFQGPGGRMAVVMQTTDEGYNDAGDTWISTSTGGAWSTPVCVTNNAARASFWAKDTGVLSGVSGGSRFGPGEGAAAYDKDGHLNLALINVQCGSFGLSAGGVVYSSGSTSTPTLYFYRF